MDILNNNRGPENNYVNYRWISSTLRTILLRISQRLTEADVARANTRFWVTFVFVVVILSIGALICGLNWCFKAKDAKVAKVKRSLKNLEEDLEEGPYIRLGANNRAPRLPAQVEENLYEVPRANGNNGN